MDDPLANFTPRRIALIKPSALGDVVHALPVLSALRRHWPGAHITWVINRAYEPLIAGHPDLDATIAFDRGALRGGWLAGSMSALRFARQMRLARFDFVIDLQGLLRTGLMTFATGAKTRIGFANAREGAARFYTHRVEVPDAEQIHAVDRYWRVVEAVGAGDQLKQFHVPIAKEAQIAMDKLLTDWRRPWLMVAPGARWTTKRWPAENFAAAARHVLNRSGGSVVLAGSREDEAIARRIAAAMHQPVLNLTGQTSLPLLAALLNRADLVLGNDSGPLHLAAALGRPVVAPYTCTLVRKHGPYGQFHRAAAADISCHGSYLRTCDHMSCMKTLPVERMTPMLDEALSQWQLRQSA